VLRARAKECVGKGGTVTPHTLRKCFVYWCSEAGINRSRIRAYVGHGIQSITDIYEKHEVDSHLDGDAKTLREFVENAKRGPGNKAVDLKAALSGLSSLKSESAKNLGSIAERLLKPKEADERTP
jgi:hypothetical protein